MDWVATAALLTGTATAVIGTLKDFTATDPEDAAHDAQAAITADAQGVPIGETSIAAPSPTLHSWVAWNRLPLAKVGLALVATVIGVIALANSAAAANQAKVDLENGQNALKRLETQNGALTIMLAGSRSTKPKIRLFMKSAGTHHAYSAWDEEAERANAIPASLSLGTIGFIGSSARDVIFFAPREAPSKYTDVIGYINLMLGGMQNQLDVHATGMTRQFSGQHPMEVKVQTPGTPYAHPATNKESDAFYADFQLTNEWRWDSVLSWVEDRSRRQLPVMSIIEGNVKSCPAAPVQLSEATVTFDLQDKPRFGLVETVKIMNFTCKDHLINYSLVPTGPPDIRNDGIFY